MLRCDGSPVPASASIAQAYTHEEIASFCLRSDVIGGEEGYVRAEKEWAQSEVGEGVEEVWERSVGHAYRLWREVLTPRASRTGRKIRSRLERGAGRQAGRHTDAPELPADVVVEHCRKAHLDAGTCLRCQSWL